MLGSSDRSALYVVTDKSIFYDGSDVAKEVEVKLPEDFVLSKHKIV